MADTPPENDGNVKEEDAPQKKRGKSSLLGKIKVFFAVGVVIAVECIAAFLYLPSAAETRALAESTIEVEEAKEFMADDGFLDEEDPANQMEVDLGEFTVAAFQPVSNSTLRMDFHLYGTIREEDGEKFHELLQGNENRFREQVIVTVRSADSADLTDAGLNLVKRKILEKTNRILGKPLLKGVIVSDFSFVEQ